MTLHTRLLLPLVVALARRTVGIGPSVADGAALPSAESAAEATGPAAAATGAERDGGCAVRPPGCSKRGRN